MAKKRFQCNLQMFRSLRSIKYRFSDGDGGYCAQGKLARACGVDDRGFLHPTRHLCETEIFLEYLGRYEGSPTAFKWHQVSMLNNAGRFEEADALALKIAFETGRVDFVGGVADACYEGANANNSPEPLEDGGVSQEGSTPAVSSGCNLHQ